MRIFQSKEFARFARKQRIAEGDLCRAIGEIMAGCSDADLGGGVHKQRIARTGEGKSGGFRTIILMKIGALAIFVYGFAKSERANISQAELAAWRSIARDMLPNDAGIRAAVDEGKLIEVKCDEGNED